MVNIFPEMSLQKLKKNSEELSIICTQKYFRLKSKNYKGSQVKFSIYFLCVVKVSAKVTSTKLA
jgi:hypothetical protein